MNPLRRSTEGNVYRKAAEMVLTMEDSCCCFAILRSGEDSGRFEDAFFPGIGHGWPSDAYDWGWGLIDDDSKDARLQRCLALCFMAAMVEAGDA